VSVRPGLGSPIRLGFEFRIQKTVPDVALDCGCGHGVTAQHPRAKAKEAVLKLLFSASNLTPPAARAVLQRFYGIAKVRRSIWPANRVLRKGLLSKAQGVMQELR
jgi:hypothetical protein